MADPLVLPQYNDQSGAASSTEAAAPTSQFVSQGVRSYAPTWRDHVANFFLGDNPSEHTRRMVRETFGSSGIGSAGLSAVDVVPGVGAILGLQESLQEGDPAAAGGYAAQAAVPLAGTAVKAAMPLIKPLARAGVAGAAGLAAGVTTALFGQEASAAQGDFTPQQKYVLNRAAPETKDSLRQQFLKENTYNADQEGIISTLAPDEAVSYRGLSPQKREEFLQQRNARLADESQAKKTAETLPEHERNLFLSLGGEGRAKFLEDKRLAATQEQQRQAEQARTDHEALEPFRKRYKTLWNYVPAVAEAAAAAIPYGVKLSRAMSVNHYLRGWEAEMAAAEEALQAGKMDVARNHINALRSYNEVHADKLRKMGLMEDSSIKKPGVVSTATGASIPFGLEYVTPNAIDATTLPPGSENQKAAVRALTDPTEYLARLPSSLAQGALAAKPAGYLWTPGRNIVPSERSAGLTQTFDQLEKTRINQERAARAAETRRLNATKKKKS
jgi:hypothetical protein